MSSTETTCTVSRRCPAERVRRVRGPWLGILLAWPAAGLLLGASQIALAGSGAIAARLADGTVALENETIKLVVDPAHGGSVIHFVHKPFGKDVVPPQRGHDRMGLLLDHYWKDGWPWPGEMMPARYEPVEVASRPDRAAVALRYTLKGSWAGKSDPQIRGLIFEKTIALQAGVDAVFCHAVFRNPTDRTKMVAYWIQNYYHVGGDYDTQTDVFARPTTTGIFRGGRMVQKDFIRDVARGWTAATDTEKNHGLVFLMDYNYLNCLYNFSNNATQEWVYDRVLIPPGKAWKTEVVLLPFSNVRDIAHASENLIAGLHVARQGEKIVLTHSLRQGVRPAENVQLRVEIVSGSSDRKARSSLDAGDLDTETKVLEQRITEKIPDPLIVQVAATGSSGGRPFREHYWDFYVGSYGYGANVRVDMVTPVYREKRPDKNPVLLKPDHIRRIPGKRLFYTMSGLYSEYYRLDEAFNLAGRQPAPKGMPSVGYYTLNTYGMGPQISDFPFDYDRLMRYSAVVVANVHIDCVGPIGREMLLDYVTHGGGLLVLGGMAAYSSSRWNNSPLGEVLPVELQEKPFDVRKIAAGVLRLGRAHPITSGIQLTGSPRADYVHQVRAVRKGAEVLLYAGDHPFLVIWKKGRGRVACVLGTPYGPRGIAPDHAQYFDWQHWPALVGNVLRWLSQTDE